MSLVKSVRAALLVGLVLGCTAGSASAQLFQVGSTNNVLPGTVRGTDSAFDPGNGVYLVVGAHGVVNGVFVNASGVALTAPFAISNGAGHAHFPRVAYGAGGFLVTWHQNIGQQNYVHARRVTYPGGLGSESVISSLDPPASGGSWWEAGAALAFSSSSQRFLVAWQTCCGGNSVVQARSVDIHGTPVAPIQQISNGYARDPGVAWNSALNEFGISFSGADASSATAVFARTNLHGGVLRRTVVGRGAGTYISDIAFNQTAGRYVMVWFQGATYGAEIDGAGDALAVGLVSPSVGAYDGLGLAFQPVSGTFLLVGHHSTGEIGAVELNGRGARFSGEIAATTTGGRGMFYPRASSSGHEKKWNTAASGAFTAVLNQAVGTTTSDGGSSTSLGSPPPSSTSPTPAPAPSPTACPGSDPFASIGGGTCVNGGWQPPGSGSSPAPPPTCSVSFSPTGYSFGTAGGPASFTVTTSPAGCAWTVSSGASWISINGPSSRNGSDSVGYTVAPNAGLARTGTINVAGQNHTVSQGGYQPTSRRLDFNEDGHTDIVWQNRTTGELALWRMNGLTVTASTPLQPGRVSDTGWKVVGSSDFNGDGYSDLVWQHDTGYVAVWLMRGDTMMRGELITSRPISDTAWRIVAVGDLDGNSWPDLLWQHASGAISVWYMRGLQMLSGELIGNNRNPLWRVVGADDFNGDGRLDLVLRNSAEGENLFWLLNDRTILASQGLSPNVANLDWEIVGTGDHNADARPDLLWRNSRSGELVVWLMNGTTLLRSSALNPRAVPNVDWTVVGPR